MASERIPRLPIKTPTINLETVITNDASIENNAACFFFASVFCDHNIIITKIVVLQKEGGYTFISMLSSSSFYDAVAHEYKNYCNVSGANETIEEEIFLLSKHNPKTVLELGIGDGRFAREYLKIDPSCDYTGVDNSRVMLSYANDVEAKLICIDMLSFCRNKVSESASYDAIITPYSAVHHVNKNEQLQLFTFMKQLSKLIMINCLAEDSEKALFKKDDETTLTFVLPDETHLETRVHKLHEIIRSEMVLIHEGGNRETLLYLNNK